MLYNSIDAFPAEFPEMSEGKTWSFSTGATLQFFLRLASRSRLIAFSYWTLSRIRGLESSFSGWAAHSYNHDIWASSSTVSLILKPTDLFPWGTGYSAKFPSTWNAYSGEGLRSSSSWWLLRPQSDKLIRSQLLLCLRAWGEGLRSPGDRLQDKLRSL